MLRHKTFLSIYIIVTFLLLSFLVLALPAIADRQRPLSIELFGVPLKNATRTQLRQVFRDNGLQPVREDNSYWYDIYNSRKILEGTSELEVGYVAKTTKFAVAQYTFPSFMDTHLVEKVINMVAVKYGRPSSQTGNYNLGSVRAIWKMGQGMGIEVKRGWPNTTTYLSLIDYNAYRQMRAEIDDSRKAEERRKAISQGKAF